MPLQRSYLDFRTTQGYEAKYFYNDKAGFAPFILVYLAKRRGNCKSVKS